ncbi:hypothetical protein DL96DRAFT_1717442 [Flagelloscypha sp. PMI_526]|nr:hypothetical protein DL96DRAFT_1717442 [Flagelloscypha sp. PMI_526]
MSTPATTTQVDKTPSVTRDIEAILIAMRICHRNQETKVWIVEKFMHALQEGEATSKLHLQPRLSQYDGFQVKGSSYNGEAFGGILKQVEQNYSKLLSEEKNLTQDLRNVIPSSVLFIMSPSTYRDKDNISNWIPVVLPQDDWGLFEGLEYGGKQPCWVTSTSHTGISGMVNAGVRMSRTFFFRI